MGQAEPAAAPIKTETVTPAQTKPPDWAPAIVPAGQSAFEEPPTQWPAAVEVPGWAPHVRAAPVEASPQPVPLPPVAGLAPAAAAPLAEQPVAAPTASSGPDPGKGSGAAATTAGAQPAWEIVEQKPLNTSITRTEPTGEDRSYAEWFAWAKRGGAPASACHAAAQGAFRALAAGNPVKVAVEWAATAMASPPLEVDEARMTYCAWYSLGNIDLDYEPWRAHIFATAGIHALQAGADTMVAHNAGVAAAEIKPPEVTRPEGKPPA